MLRLQITRAIHEDVFIDRYERLFAWAMQLTGGKQAQAEDLVHDAFLHLSLQKPDLSGIENLDAYLYRVLRNLQISQARRAAVAQKSTVRLSDYDSAQLSLHATRQDDRARVEAELRAICDCVCERKRSSKTASALILRFFLGYYPAEIMRVARLPGQAVDKLLWMARREARDYIEQRDAAAIQEKAPAADIIRELRQRIFASCDSPCPGRREWRELYRDSGDAPVDTPVLSHLVSCPDCLATVNRLLSLKPLDDRDPPEMLGPGERPQRIRKESERRTSQTIEHKPKELHILVNGFEQFSQEISSPDTHFHLTMNGDERPGFVEVISEQGVRLLFLTLDPPPDGPVEQRANVALEQWRMEVSVQFRTAPPVLELRYAAPGFEALEPVRSLPDIAPRRGSRFGQFLGWLRQPVLLGVAVLLPLLGLLFYRVQQPPVSAAAVLREAIGREAAADAKPGARHRVMRLDAPKTAGDINAGSGRVEVWRSPLRRTKVVRLTDDQRRLVSAVWTGSSGVERWIRPAAMQSSPLAVVPPSIWQSDLSAADFASRVTGDRVNVEIGKTGVRLMGGSGTELRLGGSDLHAVERITRNGQYTYRLTEIASEVVSEPQVPSGALELPTESPRDTASATTPAPDLGDLEIDVLSRLDAAGALTGEDVTVSQTTRGVEVRAVVETPERKEELARALAGLSGDHLRLQIRTIDEAVREQALTQPPPHVVLRSVEVPPGEIPAYPELRRFFDAEQARRFAEDMLRHSLQVRLQARAFQMWQAQNNDDSRVRAKLREHAGAIAEETATIRRHLEPIFPPPEAPAAKANEPLYRLAVRQDELLRAMFSLQSATQSTRPAMDEFWRVLAAIERSSLTP